MGIGDILDTTIRLYRQNWRLFFTVAACGYIPITIIGLLYNLVAIGPLNTMNSSLSDVAMTGISQNALTSYTGATSFICLAGLFFNIASGVISVLLVGAITSSVAQRFLGQSVTTREAYLDARHCFWRILGVSIVIGIIIGVIYLVFVLAVALGVAAGIGVGAAGGNLMICGTVGFVFIAALVAVATYFIVRWSLVLQAIILEGKGVFASMGRSSDLVKGGWWRTFAIMIVGGLFFAVVFALPTNLIQFGLMAAVGAFTKGGLLAATTSPFVLTVSALASAVFGILSAPIIPAISTMYYYDRRIRKEGYDLEVMNENLA
jgi:hypothetical protein